MPVKGTGASSSFTGTSPIGGTGTTSTGGGPAVDPCAFSRTASGTPVLAGQVVRNQSVGRAEVYAELTDAEVLALKQGGSLIPPSTQPAQPSFVMPPLTALLTQELSVTSGDRHRLVQELINRFPATRSTWPNPWALRLVDHPGSEHMNPVRIVFKPDALIIRITDTTPIVFDVKNAQITPAQALLTPERIVGVFYATNAMPGASQCETGKRELALGNEAMVESFSLGTKEILARLNSDIDDLNAFFQVARPCANVTNAMAMLQTFHNGIVCGVWSFPDATTEYNAYGWSLSNPVELYKPTPQGVASLISALEADRFDVDPFVGTPHPSVGAGGDGGVGGADVGGGGAGGADSGFPQGGI